MNKEILEKSLVITKKGKPAYWVNSCRYTSADNRYGYSSAICSSYGNLTRIIRTNKYYTKIKYLVKISPKCVFIESMKTLDGTSVEIYKVDSIDCENKKVVFSKIATYKDNKWDNSSYVKTYKAAIHSTLMRAKKYYNLMDIK